jgi:hypothetical protein
MWKAHVDGERPLGIVPIRTDDTVVWGSIDYDVYGEDLTALIKKVESLKLPLVPGAPSQEACTCSSSRWFRYQPPP